MTHSDKNYHLIEANLYVCQLISDGNLQEVKTALSKNYFLQVVQHIILSENAIQNIRYHFVASISSIAQCCLKTGMPKEQADTLSMQYIRKADCTQNVTFMLNLYDDACLAFAIQMQKWRWHTISSSHIIDCLDYIQQNIGQKLSVSIIADHLHLHPNYLSKLFLAQMGCSLHTYILEQKIEVAKTMLQFTDASCHEIATTLSFSSHSHFIQSFQKCMNMTPNQYRNFAMRFDYTNQPTKEA
jgi:AraC-like DNA-binding protein